MVRRRGSVVAVGVLLLLACIASARAEPAPRLTPGRYDAELCVANPRSAPPSCGTLELRVLSPRRYELRLADVAYRLDLRSSQLALVIRQGTMQLDEFDADYAWEGGALRFDDPDKDIGYRVRPGARRR